MTTTKMTTTKTATTFADIFADVVNGNKIEGISTKVPVPAGLAVLRLTNMELDIRIGQKAERGFIVVEVTLEDEKGRSLKTRLSNAPILGIAGFEKNFDVDLSRGNIGPATDLLKAWSDAVVPKLLAAIGTRTFECQVQVLKKRIGSGTFDEYHVLPANKETEEELDFT